jgi:hypothetical protein
MRVTQESEVTVSEKRWAVKYERNPESTRCALINVRANIGEKVEW